MSTDPGANAISETSVFNRSEVAPEISPRQVMDILLRYVVHGVAAAREPRSGPASPRALDFG